VNAREEAQEYYVMRFHKARNHRLSGQPERRGKQWPRTARWWRNDEQCRLERELGKAESATDCNL
jgi:hypothetical protein